MFIETRDIINKIRRYFHLALEEREREKKNGKKVTVKEKKKKRAN